MIVTLTPNPSLDRTVTLPGPLLRGAVNRLDSVTVEPGGKGVNVARVLAASGQQATALVPAAPGDPLLKAIESLGLAGLTCRAVPVDGAARVNTAVTEPDGTTTKLNESGAGLSEAEIAAIEGALSEELRLASEGRSWAVLSGSLPPGAPVDWYVRLVGLLRPLGVRIAVDTSDAPLAALAAGLPDCAPDLVKPNGEELAQLAGRGATDLEDAAVTGDFGRLARHGSFGSGGLHGRRGGFLHRGLHPGRRPRRRAGRVPAHRHGVRFGRREPARHHSAHAARSARAGRCDHPARLNAPIAHRRDPAALRLDTAERTPQSVSKKRK